MSWWSTLLGSTWFWFSFDQRMIKKSFHSSVINTCSVFDHGINQLSIKSILRRRSSRNIHRYINDWNAFYDSSFRKDPDFINIQKRINDEYSERFRKCDVSINDSLLDLSLDNLGKYVNKPRRWARTPIRYDPTWLRLFLEKTQGQHKHTSTCSKTQKYQSSTTTKNGLCFLTMMKRVDPNVYRIPQKKHQILQTNIQKQRYLLVKTSISIHWLTDWRNPKQSKLYDIVLNHQST